MSLRAALAALPVLAMFALAAPPRADAARALYVHGRGFGHGVGMSQWGAYGYALHGRGYRSILRHYYRHTRLGTISPRRTVRVLLQQDVREVAFSGAVRAGRRHLSPRRTYRVRRHGAHALRLLSARGRRLATLAAPLAVNGPGPLRLNGQAQNGVTGGRYRGALEIRPAPSAGLDAINAVGIESYLRGVVAAESPASWPAAALEAQAVAARGYAITTGVGGDGYDQYADTRSQMYEGVAAEHPSTNAAVRATRGQVVTYRGKPVTTYFFSSSGGRTEDVQNAFPGSPAEPYLVSVRDPWDKLSPMHTWGPLRIDPGKLGNLVKGRFRRIKVLARGASPRILKAVVIGSRGRTRVSGAELRTRLGLPDTWAYFTRHR